MADITVARQFKEHVMAMDSDGEFTQVEVPYVVFGSDEEEKVLAAVHDAAPEEWEGLPIESLEIASREGSEAFTVNVIYKNKASSTSSSKEKEEDDPTVSFDCGGGTRHMTHSYHQSLAHGTKKAGGAIGWNGKSGAEMAITGVDVPTAQLRETYTKVLRLSKITTTYKRKVAKLVGKVNSSDFKGWNKGEVMFLGMSYSAPAKKSTKVTVTFNFAIQPNEEVEIGGVKVAKKGFEYAWALSKTEVAEGIPKAAIEAIYVDQVCQYDSFSELGL